MAKESLVARLLTLPAFQEVGVDEPVMTEKQKEREKRRIATLLKDFLPGLPNLQESEK